MLAGRSVAQCDFRGVHDPETTMPDFALPAVALRAVLFSLTAAATPTASELRSLGG